MRRFLQLALTVAVLSAVWPNPGQPATEHMSAGATIEREFDAAIDPAIMSSWMRTLASAPNQVGSEHDAENANMLLHLYKGWGWNAHIEQFQVLYPTPVSETLELMAPDGSINLEFGGEGDIGGVYHSAYALRPFTHALSIQFPVRPAAGQSGRTHGSTVGRFRRPATALW